MVKKRVLVLASTFPRWRGDTTPSFVLELTRRMTPDFSVTVLAPHDPSAKKKERMTGIDVRRFAYFKPESLQRLCYGGGMLPNLKHSLLARIQLPFFLLSQISSCWIESLRVRPKMIHAHWILPQGLAGALIKRTMGTKLLVTIHGSDLFALKGRLLHSLQSFVLRTSDMITVNSEIARKELLRRFPSVKRKIKVIPMGVDTSLFSAKKTKNPFSSHHPILFVGRLSEQKGLSVLIRSLAETKNLLPKAHLYIAGEGPEEKNIREMIASYSLQDRVTLLGAVGHGHLQAHYSNASVVVLPSLSGSSGRESLGLSAIEAMSCGTPVITTKVAGISSFVSKNGAGIVVDQNNPKALSKAIHMILSGPKRRARMGRKAKAAVVTNFSWSHVHSHFKRVYAELLR